MKLNLNPNNKIREKYSFKKQDIHITDVTAQRLDDRRELILLLFFIIDYDKYGIVDSLEIDCDYAKEFSERIENCFKSDKKIEFFYGTIPIGEGSLKKTTTGNYKIIDIFLYKNEKAEEKNKTKDLRDFFTDTNEKKLNNEESFKKYATSMIKIYYDYLVKFCKYYNKLNKPNKLSGMMSYLAFEDYISQKNKNIKNKKDEIILSNPNCYIEGYWQELDALLLNPLGSYKQNTHIYKKEDVKAVVELKTSGVMYESKYFKVEFLCKIILPYLSNEIVDYDKIIDNLIEYAGMETNKKFSWNAFFKKLEENKKNQDNVETDVLNIINKNIITKEKMPSFIYFATSEREGTKKAENHYYTNTTSMIDNYNKKCQSLPRVNALFATSRIHADKFVMPKKEHIDIEAIVK